VALKAVALVTGHFLVALCAIVHLHPVPGVLLVTCRVCPPNIPAVQGESVVIVRLHVFRLAHRSMTGDTFHLANHHMSGMREEDALRLAGIDEPWNLLAGLNILLDELFLFRMFSHLFFVTLKTTG
jgi:hypothetical protein